MTVDIPGTPRLGTMLLWILAVWILFTIVGKTLFKDTSRLLLSYSEFKEQLSTDNVKSIIMKGASIKGTFRSAYSPQNGTQSINDNSYNLFATIRPPVHDPGLIRLFQKNDVEVIAQTHDSSWWTSILFMFLPWLLFIGFFMWISHYLRKDKRNLPGIGGIFGVGKSRARLFREPRTRTTYNDVAGLENPKRDLREIVEYLKNPKKFISIGAQIPRGVLLMGPPGTGKTLLARAMAGEAEVPFYSISGSEFIAIIITGPTSWDVSALQWAAVYRKNSFSMN